MVYLTTITKHYKTGQVLKNSYLHNFVGSRYREGQSMWPITYVAEVFQRANPCLQLSFTTDIGMVKDGRMKDDIQDGKGCKSKSSVDYVVNPKCTHNQIWYPNKCKAWCKAQTPPCTGMVKNPETVAQVRRILRCFRAKLWCLEMSILSRFWWVLGILVCGMSVCLSLSIWNGF